MKEGNYNTWIKKWTNEPTGGLYWVSDVGIFIDERSETLSIFYYDSSFDSRFAIYNLSDFSTVFESPAGSSYKDVPMTYVMTNVDMGATYFVYGGVSRSLQTYLLLARDGLATIEVWRGGLAPLWSRILSTDFGAACTSDTGSISLTGKYVLVLVESAGTHYIMLYDGFHIGPSTAVTETIITDLTGVWTPDLFIGHMVTITSGGANGQTGIITSNTATSITCSAASFVTWGMSVGDTFRID